MARVRRRGHGDSSHHSCGRGTANSAFIVGYVDLYRAHFADGERRAGAGRAMGLAEGRSLWLYLDGGGSVFV